MRKTTLAGAVALSLLSLNVHALSVGNMQVSSHLGEPLNISIDLNSIDENEYSTLEVKLASREMFTQAGIEYPRNVGALQVALGEYEDGKAQISVKTSSSVSDPFVHLLLSIKWSGGNILREYTALLDPVDYQAEPLAQATSPDTSVGLSRPMQAPAAAATGEERFHSVGNGDSLSAIAALYRPSDVTIQQAWMAFYNLNRDAFPGGNLNHIQRGARLRVPSDEQLRAMSQEQALQEVRRLARPLQPNERRSAPPAPGMDKPEGPTLVVGGSSGNAAQPAASGTGSATDKMQLSELQGYDQLASVVTELSEFTQTIRQEISSSRERDELLKEELIAARGENRVLTERMARLEAQIARMSELLELQGSALQAISAGQQPAAPGLALDQLEAAETAPTAAPSAPEPAAVAEQPPAQEQPAAPAATEPTAAATGESPRSYYEQLLDEAISDAPEEDLAYIEEVLGQSSTSIGLQDTNPVTPEMEARAAAARRSAPAAGENQETADMLADVRASLGELSGATGDSQAPQAEIEIAEQDINYLDALDQEDRSQIEKSEARIAQLEQELQARIRAAQQQSATPSQAPSEPASAPATEQEQTPATADSSQPAPETPVRTVAQDSGLMDTLTGQIKDISQSVSNGLGEVTSDVWRLLGGLGAAVIGLMVILGLRRRKTEPAQAAPQAQPDSVNIALGDDESEEDVADLATKSLQQEPEDEVEEEELHGSSLFDLSDESFMASEAIQDDSSLFSMDDNEDMDSLTEMDSAQLGGQSTMTQAVDVDPIAEADVYLAYDRKEQAIDVLEQALSKNPNQSAVVIKLLGLYQQGENIEAFTRLFESSAEHIEDDDDWNKIKMMAQDFVPGHEMLADDFDSSIPVLNDEIVADTQPLPEETASGSKSKSGLELAADDQEMAPLAADDDIADDESLNLVLSEDETDNIELQEEIDTAVEEVNQHEPDTALALAKAYIELGETDIARDFLLDVINAGGDDLKAEAQELLDGLG